VRARGPVRVAVALVLGLSALMPSVARTQSVGDEAAARLSEAVAIQAATRARLGVLGDAFTCADARFVAYRRSDAEPDIVDQWYVASQLWADAVLLRVAADTASGDQAGLGNWDAQESRCYLDKGFVFLDRLWDFSSAGYFPRSNPVGADVETGARFADDNLVAGLALLATARTSSDPYTVERLIHAARRQADFLLLEGGLWDATFGGGFWWNTGRGDSPEGKPAQTNALAALFFARLYAATGEVTYREWALRSLLWLDTILYDPRRHLYRWSVSYQDFERRSGATISQRYFNYDQGIAIEAQLAAAQLDGDPNRLARAQAVGHAAQAAFWSSDLGGYNLEAGIEQVFTSYGTWTSLGDLALYDADGDSAWLELARANAQSLQRTLREADGGVAYRVYRCVDRVATGCESGTVARVVDHTRDTAAQAWVQHLQAALAERTLIPNRPADVSPEK